MKNSEKKRFKFFDMQRDGRGVSKLEQMSESGLKRFFFTLKNSFGKITTLNIIFVLGNFPIIFLLITLSGYTKDVAYLPTLDVFQNFGGAFMIEGASPSAMIQYAIEGLHNSIQINTATTYVFYGISALTALTFGMVNVGTAYVLRNIAQGEPVFVWSDFIYAIKRNWKQAIPFGIIDSAIIALLAFNIYTTISSSDFVISMMFWATIVIIILYFFMRCYIYIQMVTFKLTVFKILKNSLIFALLGFKRNLLALLGNALIILLEFTLLVGTGSIGWPFAVGLPLLILISLMAYMKVYAAFFKIKEIMIDPYVAEHPELYAQNDEEDDEIIMRDDVTERERLAEIKRRNNIQ